MVKTYFSTTSSGGNRPSHTGCRVRGAGDVAGRRLPPASPSIPRGKAEHTHPRRRLLHEAHVPFRGGCLAAGTVAQNIPYLSINQTKPDTTALTTELRTTEQTTPATERARPSGSGTQPNLGRRVCLAMPACPGCYPQASNLVGCRVQVEEACLLAPTHLER